MQKERDADTYELKIHRQRKEDIVSKMATNSHMWILKLRFKLNKIKFQFPSGTAILISSPVWLSAHTSTIAESFIGQGWPRVY